MKTQISRQSHDPSKRFTGVYQQQGRMITDADWNESQDIVRERLARALHDIVGDGTPGSGGLEITSNLDIVPGRVYAGGAAGSPSETQKYRYDTQLDYPDAPGTPAAGEILYADVWEREVTYLEDKALQDPALAGADTCSRLQTMVQVKRLPPGVAQGSAGSSFLEAYSIGNARLTLNHRSVLDLGGESTTAVDPDERLGNYVFRVEVHHVEGPPNAPTSVVLKWSSENAAEAHYGENWAASMPRGFIAPDWVYEFYSVKGEKQLGVQFLPNGEQWWPERGYLYTGTWNEWPGGGARMFVRRWDGYCELQCDTASEWKVVDGFDRGVKLPQSAGHGEARVQSGKVELSLAALTLSLELTGKTFLAGDHWLVTVRETDDPAHPIVDQASPVGIVHRYVKLGTVVNGGGFQPVERAAFSTLGDLSANLKAMSQLITQLQVTNARQDAELQALRKLLQEQYSTTSSADARYLRVYHEGMYAVNTFKSAADEVDITNANTVNKLDNGTAPKTKPFSMTIAYSDIAGKDWYYSGPEFAKIEVRTTYGLGGVSGIIIRNYNPTTAYARIILMSKDG